ncbi:unnamed protein product [Cuscuta epithymum]|uniref:Domain X domain-containing protein n=1 Tax=Cuscuta epithymum TaxID=186058 RepID=A0AAV0D5P5_9ASTE|nr:unnamed protein product [Cuscuta epithymum]
MLFFLFRRAKAARFRLSAAIHVLKPPPAFHLSTASSLHPNPSKPLSKPELKALVLSHCHHGKFHNLLREVIASPHVLLSACSSLKSNGEPLDLESISAQFFSVEELSSHISENRLEVESCCCEIPPSSRRGKPLVLPNLKLKVVMEAIRMVLEVVYDDRFVTFSYGGRVNMGRHTAIRYLKNSVENPSWWFTVSFNHEKFGINHVAKLCLIIEEKIKDDPLIDFLKRLCKCEAISIHLGGCYLGRGFPQECRLTSILINIYFNSFDKNIQEMRLKANTENPKIGILSDSSGSAFYKPPKVHAVRYLDEILMITSGTKLMTMELKGQVVKILEKNLGLSVNKAGTVIHSAVSEKIDFLGMELQAVTPSVLHPPMSEKAMRARKKYLRQKEVRLLELKNARETNRKKLGMKILNHCFKKLKHCNDGFKFDFHIENEVRQIFKMCSDDVVKQFLESVDERWEWYRQLSAGDFLSLERIREKLPGELIHAYDDFQEQVDKFLNPMQAKKKIEDSERRLEEEEERRYSERTVQDLTKRCIKVEAPIETVRKAVQMSGITNHMGRPRPISPLVVLEDADIIKWYAGVGRRWLDFFCCCHNFKNVKTVVTYHLRFSCILTLAEKHESTKRETIRHFSKDLKVLNVDGTEDFHFPTEREVKMMGDNALSDPKPVDGALTMALIRLASDEPSYLCAAHFCGRNDTTVYRIRFNPLDQKWVPGMGSAHDSLNRKCLPLCPVHISEVYMGRMTLQDIDCCVVLDLD